MCILEVSELCKAYPSFQLRDVSFSLKEGRITGLWAATARGKPPCSSPFWAFCIRTGGDHLFRRHPF